MYKQFTVSPTKIELIHNDDSQDILERQPHSHEWGLEKADGTNEVCSEQTVRHTINEALTNIFQHQPAAVEHEVETGSVN